MGGLALLQARILFVMLSILIVATASGAALAARRVALVVGNSAYTHAGLLPNTINDAADMTAVLKQKGFSVIEGINLDTPTFIAKVQEFARAAKGTEIALFFYAGHGLQIAGHNYLMPIDAELATAAAVNSELVPASLVYRAIEGGARFKIVVLDACRNNPLADQLKEAMGARSAAIGRGLAREDFELGSDLCGQFLDAAR